MANGTFLLGPRADLEMFLASRSRVKGLGSFSEALGLRGIAKGLGD